MPILSPTTALPHFSVQIWYIDSSDHVQFNTEGMSLTLTFALPGVSQLSVELFDHSETDKEASSGIKLGGDLGQIIDLGAKISP